MPTRERKQVYFGKMTVLLDTYQKILIVQSDHVGSQQLHQIRQALRGTAEVLMGKNTLMRKVVTSFMKGNESHPIEALLPLLKGNIGLIFTNVDFGQIRKVIDSYKVPAAAKAGVLAECDVVVPPGPTGCDPGQTAWFQALNVPTKITKGQIEIVSELKLVNKGEKVTQSEAALLQKLNIKPFTYGFVLQHVYDAGKVFSAAVLDITSEVLEAKFLNSVRTITSIALGAGLPNLCTVPHSIGNGVRRLVAVAAASGYSFKQMEALDKLLNMDPAELAKLQAASSSVSGAAGGAGKAAAVEEKKEEAVEEVVLGGGNLFGAEKSGY